MRKRLFRSLIRQDISFFDSQCVGTLASRLINDTEDLQAIVSDGGTKLLTAVLNCVGGVSMMLATDVTMSVVGLLGIPLFLATTGNASKLSGYYGLLINDALAEGNTVATEALANIEAVQANCAEDSEVAKYERSQDAYLNLVGKTQFSESVLNQTKQLLLQSADFLLLVLGMYRVVRGEVTLGRCLAFRSYLRKLYSGLDRLLEIYGDFYFSLQASERYFDLVDRVSAIQDGEGVPPNAPTKGNGERGLGKGQQRTQEERASREEENASLRDDEGGAVPERQKIATEAEQNVIEFRNVSLAFPSSAVTGAQAAESATEKEEEDSTRRRRRRGEVLSDVSFRAGKGQIVAIVGRSGAGKSTLAKLMHRFYDPQEGSILLNGVDIRSLRLHHLRSRIGFVEQEPLLLRQSIAENIAYGLYSPLPNTAQRRPFAAPSSPFATNSRVPFASSSGTSFSSLPRSTSEQLRKHSSTEENACAEKDPKNEQDEDDDFEEIFNAKEAESWPRELLMKTVRAAKVAHAHEFIRRLPRGYFTLCGDGAAVRLSGGQKQRIAIARSLCRDPQVFVFDEATSCLDAATEAAVEATLDLLRKRQKTIFVIAHKLATTRKADFLIALDKGCIVESGYPEEILERPNSRYAQLFADKKPQEAP
ncbi:putative ATP-binding cassette sub-family B member 5 [Neospora caninum Liverpool]|uniref:ATP-binding cassette sub-family B member 5,putative n=1 Tax=Neospora caninum (strain Liverpool) TaxID=572307 RepID=F0VR22_NEOCL|nr:putative ATP-binding cassette sub-family B member 5 [Neospora caninum Liverpool]CBZ56169.1 putative ATP-binding cassette sub-family B member 5 [Neospora caninum Liverpool]CEL70926.1 TPA: ATP-binding cassette sub-family B member 5,putative [Neospora caninum Liverpool]|eukprot:XP_003886195.1 putative ATP-binding cassette sub-family B member 5 [Neospora caninum Liverpool]